jgi:hypothetical protein
MARVTLSASGLAGLARIVDERLVHPVTDAVAEDMRRMVPVLSGDLLATIEAEHGAGFGRVHFGDVDSGVDYHLYQEFGTSRMAAQPYARPALYRRRTLG